MYTPTAGHYLDHIIIAAGGGADNAYIQNLQKCWVDNDSLSDVNIIAPEKKRLIQCKILTLGQAVK